MHWAASYVAGLVLLAATFTQSLATQWYPVNADLVNAGLVYSPSLCSGTCNVTCVNAWWTTCWSTQNTKSAVTMTNAASLSFTFQGINIEFWGVPLAAGGSAMISLDNEDPIEVPMVSNEPLVAPVDRKMWERDGLDSTVLHTVVIKAKDAYDANNPKYLHFHRFQVVYPDGMVSITNINPPPTTTSKTPANTAQVQPNTSTTPSTTGTGAGSATGTGSASTNSSGQISQASGSSTVKGSGSNTGPTGPSGTGNTSISPNSSNPTDSSTALPGANNGVGGGVNDASNSSGGTSNNGALIGGVVAGVGLFLGLLIVAFVLFRRRKKASHEEIYPFSGPPPDYPTMSQYASDQHLILPTAASRRQEKRSALTLETTANVTAGASTSQPPPVQAVSPTSPAEYIYHTSLGDVLSPTSPTDISPTTRWNPSNEGGSGALGLSLSGTLGGGDTESMIYHSPPPQYRAVK